LLAYAAAGEDFLYAPGIRTNEEIAAVVEAVHPKPVNLLVGFSEISLTQAKKLRVRRISLGGSLARSAWAGFMKAAKEMANSGTVGGFANGYPGGELKKMLVEKWLSQP
jgi:2-methylisocitrate lyase-like PEP mutase family enzyme